LLPKQRVGKLQLGIVVTPTKPRAGRCCVDIPPVLFGVLAVISFWTTEAEDTFLQEGVPSIPKGESKTQTLRSIAKAGKTVLVPPIGARAGVFVGEILPDLSIGTVVFAHGPPSPLTDVRPDRFPVAGSIGRGVGKPCMLSRRGWTGLPDIVHAM